MISLNKKLRKFEQYWLEDYWFRALLRSGCYDCCSKRFTHYSDLYLSENDFWDLRAGLFSYSNQKIENQQIHSFACDLNLQGKIQAINNMFNWRDSSQWSLKEDELSVEIGKLGIHYPAFFFFGLKGEKVPQRMYTSDAVLTNRAGYWYYWSINERDK